MNLIKWNTRTYDINTIDELDQIFNRALHLGYNNDIDKIDYSPFSNIKEDNKAINIFIDLPGVNKGDLKVTIDKSTIKNNADPIITYGKKSSTSVA